MEVLRIVFECDLVVNLRLRYKKIAMYALGCLNPENMFNRDRLHAEMELVGTKFEMLWEHY